MRRHPKGTRDGGRFAQDTRGATPPTAAPATPGSGPQAPVQVSSDSPASWTRHKPVWPARAATDAAIDAVDCPAEKKPWVRRAYLSLYTGAWVEAFRTWTETSPFQEIDYRTPASDAEAWAWRRQALDRTASAWTGARMTTIAELKVGDVVFRGFGVEKVHTIHPLRVHSDEQSGTPAKFVRVTTRNGHRGDVHNADTAALLLPAFAELPDADRLLR